MNLAEFRTVVRAQWPSGYQASTITDAMITMWTNWGIRRIERSNNYYWMEHEVVKNTVDGQRSYRLPVEDEANAAKLFKSELHLDLIDVNNSREPLKKWFKPTIEKDVQFASLVDTGIPTHYAIGQQQYKLYALPKHSLNEDTAFQINLDYFGYSYTLDSDGDTNEILQVHTEPLVHLVVAQGFKHGQDSEMWQWTMSLAQTGIGEIDLASDNQLYGAVEEQLRPADQQGIGDTSWH